MHHLTAACRMSASQPPTEATRPLQSRWEQLLPHRARLLRIARIRLPTLEDSEDCVQDALIRAACAANLDDTRIGPFLTTIVINLCADHGRARRTTQRMLARVHYAERQPPPDEIVCDRSEATWLHGNIDQQLSERERAVLSARVEGLSTREVAHQLGITSKAAEAAFTRARARMRLLAN